MKNDGTVIELRQDISIDSNRHLSLFLNIDYKLTQVIGNMMAMAAGPVADLICISDWSRPLYPHDRERWDNFAKKHGYEKVSVTEEEVKFTNDYDDKTVTVYLDGCGKIKYFQKTGGGFLNRTYYAFTVEELKDLSNDL